MISGILPMNGYTDTSISLSRLYSSNGIKKAYKKRAIKRLLVDAMTHDEFELVYQPQTEMSGLNVIGVEALLRWNSLEFGMISPVTFIPAAEEAGIIQDLGDMVIEKACHQAAAWKAKYNSNLRMAVNVSYLQLYGNNIVEHVESCISKYAIDKQALEIELTESTLIKDKSRVINILNQFREMGVRTAMDDFGTGYSSLSYLASMPFDMIKIDKSFIDMLGKSSSNTVITETIIQMSKKLNMEVLAEGVETEIQRNILKQTECDLLQGNLISHPVAAEDLPKVTGMQLSESTFDSSKNN